MSVERYLFDSGQRQKHSEWKGSFTEYFQLAIKNPEITHLATQRLYRMILSHGSTQTRDGKVEYNFFKNRIFGAEDQINDIMMYFKAASMGLDIKKRVLLLLGPPGGGKSMILSHLKKGLTDYSLTPEGAIYAIDGCPINEEPMHLIPEGDRAELWQKYGIKVEGKLCPVCQFRFEKDWKKNLNNVPVKRVYISEDNRTGIGTFAPAEKNDMSELYGQVDLSRVEYYGDEADPRAYKFSGELHTANRGIMEFIEVLKAKSDFLHVLLTLAEEQQFKTPRFPLQYVDETLIAHTNEGEFYRFISVKENEAIIDRLFIVRMPYNMKVEDEEKIYHSALKSKLVVKGVGIHPGAIRLASMFVILTREHDDPLRNGMQGISPRFILNSMAIAMVKCGKALVTPEDMLNVLQYQVYNYPVLDVDTRNTYLGYLKEISAYLPDLNEVTNAEVKIKPVKQKNTMFELMIGDEEDFE